MRRRRVYYLRPWPPVPPVRLSVWERPLFPRLSAWLAFQVRCFWAWDRASGLSRRQYRRQRESLSVLLQVLAVVLFALALAALSGR